MNRHLEPGLGTLLRVLLAMLDGELNQLYRAQEVDFRPRFYPVFQLLLAQEHATISDIAKHLQASQPAATQTLAEMRKLDLVAYVDGQDRRERIVVLTDKALALARTLTPIWDAVGRAADELDCELSHPLSAILGEALAALKREGFSDRIARSQSLDGD